MGFLHSVSDRDDLDSGVMDVNILVVVVDLVVLMS